MKIKCPSCEKSLEISNISRFYNLVCKNCETRFNGLEAPVDYVSYRFRGLVPFFLSKEFYVGGSYPDSFLDDRLIHSTICYFCGKRVNIIAYVDECGKQYFTACPKCPNCLEELPTKGIYRNSSKFQVYKEGIKGSHTPKQLLKLIKSKQISETDHIWKEGWSEWKLLNTVKMFYVGSYNYILDTPDVYWENDIYKFSLQNLKKAEAKLNRFKLESNFTHSNYFNEFGNCIYR